MTSLRRIYEPAGTTSDGQDRPRLSPLGIADLPMLTRVLRLSNRADPFSRSAAYFAMTGRKGLWAYGDDRTIMLIARHPNRDGTLLLFPPIGADPAGLLRNALARPDDLPPGAAQLARLGARDRNLIASLGGGRLKPQRETVLDWTYPVHVVNPETIVQRQGKAFVSFRGHVNRAIRNGYQADVVDLSRHKGDILAVITKWAEDRNGGDFSRDDLTGPTRAVLELMERSGLDIRGTISRDRDGKPIGFWLWEQVGGTAMSLVRAYLRQHGNAEFGILNMAEQLMASGIAEMCLGGSETAELDAFKRKMQPVRSIPLETLTLPSRGLDATPRQDGPVPLRA